MIEHIGRPRLLLVDDDKDWLDEAGRFLRDKDFQVDVSSTAEEAGSLLTSGLGYWVCILDLHLGRDSAISLLQSISSLSLPAYTQFVLISGAADVKAVTQGFRHGICDFLEKPIDHETFVASINRAIAIFEQSIIARFAERKPSVGVLGRDKKSSLARSKTSGRETIRAMAWLGRLRNQFFAASLSEPEWLMVVDAYEAAVDGLACNVTSICRASGEPYATAYRYLNRLVASGLLYKQPSERDTRVIEVLPSALCRDSMDSLILAAQEKIASS
jgi:ActR/RegA family two-component response regulator